MISILRSAKKLLIVLCAFGTSYLHATLIALDDEMLSKIDGQAYIRVESDTVSGSDYKYTRINLGLSAKVQVNIDTLKLGEYARSGESNPADIDIDNFALGHIDGNNNIVPFEIEDPYIEIAYDANGRADGFRLGFASAHGSLSGDINALTGNVPVQIEGGPGPILAVIQSDLDACGWNLVCRAYNRSLLTAMGVITNGQKLSSAGELVDTNGNPDSVRATHVGIANGGGLDSSGGLSDALLSIMTASNCSILSINVCFNLNTYKTLAIGSAENPAKGFFLSLSRTSGLKWKDLDNPGTALQVTSGAYLNVPRVNGQAAIVVDFEEAFQGIPRLNTCFGSLEKGC